MERVLPQNGTRFAAKWNAFYRKIVRVLAQNGLRFGPKWVAFWPKMSCVLAQNRKLCSVFSLVKDKKDVNWSVCYGKKLYKICLFDMNSVPLHPYKMELKPLILSKNFFQFNYNSKKTSTTKQ